MPDDPIRRILDARTVAIVGASDDPTRIGGRPLRYLLASGYKGAVYPVNPGRKTVQGIPAFSDLEHLPTVPELCIVALARDQVPEVIAACGRAGIPSAIVFAAGYAETDAVGQTAQAFLTAAAEAAGVRLLGPNCNGAVLTGTGATFAFTPVLGDGAPAAGRIAIATQSAAVGTYWLRRIRERRLGMHSLIHTGNEADLGLDDVVESLLDDTTVGVVLMALEQWRRADRLPRVLDRISAATTPVVVLPLGQTSIGRLAAASHTGGLVAHRTDVVTGLLRQAGAHVVTGLDDALVLASTLEVLSSGLGNRVGILSPSGGLGVLMADALSAAGFAVPEMPEALQAGWRELVPFCGPRNPIDVTAQLVNRPELYETFVGDLIERGGVDVVAAFVPHASPDDAFARALVGAAPRAGARGVAVVAVGAMSGDSAAWLRSSGIAVFLDPLEAARTLPMVGRSASASRPTAVSTGPVRLSRPPSGLISDEMSVKSALKTDGLPVVRDEVVSSSLEAADAAEEMGFPVVLKLLVPGLAHKAKAGGVAIGLSDRNSVRTAADRLLATKAARSAGDGGRDARLMVESHVLGDELIVAATQDDGWGPLALIGLGGVDVEERSQVAFRRFPLGEHDVYSMIDEVPGLRYSFATGQRGAAVPQLTTMLWRLEQVLCNQGVRSVELNPVMVRPDGTVVIVDALVEWDEAAVHHGIAVEEE
jgi:acyl-CoA synthetase (NDP forming)